ncbi:BTAD domain-containing putative transcriptional regulator [Nesterenkonia ebinurensis]|uniref:BTAD domain-containing putative transcriptional regulator n=1 Tax=Nesterenkonia ebinurensis TaxID=2608252 RepID=UPI00123DE1CE|nr:BTAD domain-containing putative transcriptional regulator [Nesterenkonia ebinurensis]
MVQIEVLGPVQLRDDDAVVVEVPERKVRALLAALTAASGETVSADALIDRVWGEDLPGNPQRVLQAKLSQLRSLLEAASPGGRELLVRSPGGYSLVVTAETCDAAQFREAVTTAAGLPAGQQRAELLDSALKLWRGAAYAEFTDELWLAAEVADLQESRLQAVEMAAEALIAAGEPGQAVAVAGPYFAEHPTREGLAAPLLLGHYRSRRQPEALAAYERLRSHLADELGIEPTPELQQLHLSILRQDPGLIVQKQPARFNGTSAGSRSWLPSYASAFLGREEETARVLDLVAEHRLVTLLGIGGIGKTRLAVHTAQKLADETAAEVRFVDLTEVHQRDEEGVVCPVDRIYRMTAEALQLSAPWQRGENISARVLAALEARDALLVLDNCEHVINEVAAFTDELLRRAPGVRVLATSREPMGLAGEQRFVVPQLPVNGGDGSAVQFFLSRAQAVNSTIEADPEIVAAAAELCRRLDGLPLALELAAARTSVLSVPDLLERITDRLDLLARPDRAAPRRQQTLRGMLDWSWSLLEEQEQALLRRLAVHPVSWRLDVIEQVCADTEQRPALGGTTCPEAINTVISTSGVALLPRRRVLGVLANLVERSLVSTVNVGGEVRYRLLETVGTYAAEKLVATGERDAVAARHIDYYRNLVDCAQDYLFGPQAPDWVQRLDEASSHLSLAIAEALRRKDGASAVGLVLATFWYRWMTGRIDSLLEELAAAATCPNPGDSPGERRAHAQVRVLANTVEEKPSGEKVEQVLEALEGFDTDEQSQLARMQVQWFATSVMFGDAEHLEHGRQLSDQAIEHLLAAGDLRGAAFGSTQRDWFLLEFWDTPPQGLPDGYDVEQVLRDHGDAYGLIQALGVQHLWAETQGRKEEARRLADEVTALSTELNLDGETAYWLLVQAVLHLREGDLDAAEEHLQRGERLAQRVALMYCTTLHDVLAAMLAQRRGDAQRADQLLGGFSAGKRASARRILGRYFAENALPAQLQLSPV